MDDGPLVKTILDGVRHYERQTRANYTEKYARLADGQSPQALLVTCCDSRLVPNLIASTEPGDLFIVRNVANLVPPAIDGKTCSDASVSSALWYAVEVLQVPEVIVCGHSSCGGIKAVLAPTHYGDLQRWLSPVAPAVKTWREEGPLDPSFSDHDQLSQLATLQQIEHLKTYEFVQARLAKGSLRLSAWWFDISTGRTLVHSAAEGRFTYDFADRESLVA